MFRQSNKVFRIIFNLRSPRSAAARPILLVRARSTAPSDIVRNIHSEKKVDIPINVWSSPRRYGMVPSHSSLGYDRDQRRVAMSNTMSRDSIGMQVKLAEEQRQQTKSTDEQIEDIKTALDQLKDSKKQHGKNRTGDEDTLVEEFSHAIDWNCNKSWMNLVRPLLNLAGGAKRGGLEDDTGKDKFGLFT